MRILIVLVYLILVATLTGCPFMTKEDIQKQEEERQLKEQVASIQRGKADSEIKYSDLQSDIRVVSGRVDVVEHNQAVQQQVLRQEIEGLKRLIEVQNEKMKLIEQHIDATEIRLTAAIQASAAPPTTSVEQRPSTSGKATGGSYDEAEMLFSKKDYKRAILKYQAYRDKNPKGGHLAEATYKIGACFSEMGLKKDAKEFFQEVVENYPNSSFAKKAKHRISQIR